MQARRQAVLPLSLVLPHPQLIHNRSSLLSPSSPHTPRSRAVPLSLFSPSANRKSSDSWNSSTYDDEMEWEWKQEETLLLQRTLDALPAHLLTPFNGPVPPSNLLDKIARGVAHAKGPAEWPHSLRATRAKIVELARVRAKEAVRIEIVEEQCEDDPRDILRPTGRTNRKRPLYRQSSMDFILDVDVSIKDNIKDNQAINRLSQRLQRTDRILPNPTHHPYSRPSSPSPRNHRLRGQYSPVLNPSTPSSTTLNSVPSALSLTSPRLPALRRSFSSLSSSSDAYSSYPLNPRVQRIKRADSCTTPGWGNPLKRAPSFSAASIHSSESNTMSVDGSEWREKDVVSSDEEEKLRSKKAKKVRRRSPPVSPSPLPTEKVPTKTSSKVDSKSLVKPPSKTQVSPSKPSATDSTKRVTKRPRANLERNPSILGGELPKPQPHISPPSQRTSISSEESGLNSSGLPTTPATHKTLRRVKATSFAARPMARRISFSSLMTPQEENCEPHVVGAGLGLGSAFQLR